MKRFWVLLLILLPLDIVSAAVLDQNTSRQEKTIKTGNFKYKGFSGGMCLFTGYLSTGDFPVYGLEGDLLGNFKASGVPTGIGGAVRFLFGNHFRLGSEGYVTTLKYGGNGSYCTTGWGGILADYYHDVGPVALFAGLDLGVGGFKNILVTQQRNEDLQVSPDIMYDKYPILVLAPYLGTEIKIKGSFRILLKADYMMNMLSFDKAFTKGVRVYVGFVFARLTE